MYLFKKKLIYLIITVFSSFHSYANEQYSDVGIVLENGEVKPVYSAGHAPVDVMGDHMHKKGEWMVSYRFMMMTMEDNRDGTNRLDISEVLSNGSGDYRIPPFKIASGFIEKARGGRDWILFRNRLLFRVSASRE